VQGQGVQVGGDQPQNAEAEAAIEEATCGPRASQKKVFIGVARLNPTHPL